MSLYKTRKHTAGVPLSDCHIGSRHCAIAVSKDIYSTWLCWVHADKNLGVMNNIMVPIYL